MDVSYRVGEAVGTEQSAGALGPVHGYQAMLSHQKLTHILCPSDPDQRPAEQVSLEYVSILLSP